MARVIANTDRLGDLETEAFEAETPYSLVNSAKSFANSPVPNWLTETLIET